MPSPGETCPCGCRCTSRRCLLATQVGFGATTPTYSQATYAPSPGHPSQGSASQEGRTAAGNTSGPSASRDQSHTVITDTSKFARQPMPAPGSANNFAMQQYLSQAETAPLDALLRLQTAYFAVKSAATNTHNLPSTKATRTADGDGTTTPSTTHPGSGRMTRRVHRNSNDTKTTDDRDDSFNKTRKDNRR